MVGHQGTSNPTFHVFAAHMLVFQGCIKLLFGYVDDEAHGSACSDTVKMKINTWRAFKSEIIEQDRTGGSHLHET